MKRSEAVKQICMLLELQSRQGTSFMYKAEDIMRLVESIGMVLYREDRDGWITKWDSEADCNDCETKTTCGCK